MLTPKTHLKDELARLIEATFRERGCAAYNGAAEAVLKHLAISHPSEISSKFLELQKLVDETPGEVGTTFRALNWHFAQDCLDLVSKLLAEGLSKTGSDGISATLIPVIHATFETPGSTSLPIGTGSIIGSTNAPIKRVDVNDDNSLTVVIDHWPSAPEPELKHTDISERLRKEANQPGHSWRLGSDMVKLLNSAADEIERYYTGMMNWKGTAEDKDKMFAQFYAELRGVRESIEVVQGGRQELQDKVGELEEALRMEKDTVADLERQVDDWRGRFQANMAKTDWVQDDFNNDKFHTATIGDDRLDILASEIEWFRKRMKDDDEVIKDLRTERDDLAAQLRTSTATKNTLEAERNAYRSQSATRGQEIEKLLATNQELRNERNKAMGESRDANHALAAIQKAPVISRQFLDHGYWMDAIDTKHWNAIKCSPEKVPTRELIVKPESENG